MRSGDPNRARLCQNRGMSRMTRLGVCLVLVLVLGACGAKVVPQVDYRLRGMVLTPVGKPGTTDGRAAFTAAFCEAMREVDRDYGRCRDHVDFVGDITGVTVPKIGPGVKVLMVSGVLSECMEEGCTPETILDDCQKGKCIVAFCQGLAHLRKAYGVDTHYVSVPALGSSAANARVVADYLRAHPGRYITIGYSKGAVDLLEMLERFPDTRSQVAAVISVAGAISGSRVADLLTKDTVRLFQDVVKQVGLRACQVSDAGAFDSLRRETRQQFLRRFDVPADIPTYSIVGVSLRHRTSKALQLMWDRLTPYSLDHDSQVVAEEGVIPGATYLGVVHADHWAIALPFSDRGSPSDARWVDQNRFPRSALLQAVVALAASEKRQ